MSLVTPGIEAIRAYVPGKPLEELERELGIRGADKLASNENPLGPSPKAIEAIRRVASEVHYYPEGDGPYLRARLAEHLHVDARDLVLGNGSNELLELTVRTFATPNHHAVISQHAFLVYQLLLTGAQIPFTSVPTRALTHDLVAMKAALNDRTRLVFIANPNNPTGTYNTRAELEVFLEGLRPDIIVVLDEAYFEYVEASDFPDGLTLRDRHENLLVARTFSKCYGLAGLRIGYAVSNPTLVGYLNRVRQPFNTSRIAQEAALAALDDQGFVARSVAMNREQRARLMTELARRGLECVPSETNFVLVAMPRPGTEIVAALMRRGVIIRAMDGYALPDYVRVTVGRPEQNGRFLAALDRVLAE